MDNKIDITINKTTNSRLASTDFSKLSFGDSFSDHQLILPFENGAWGDAVIQEYGPIPMSPSAKILHYGQGVFEGMKAFRYKDGKINIFRADKHHQRFNRSCRRMNIPEVPEEVFMNCLNTLVDLDREWVPKDRFKSLYLRPFIVATDESLGMKTSLNYKFMIIASPVGNYYKEGINPIKLTTMPDYVRAVQGGVGEAKVPGNYAASLYPGSRAQESGYTQVLWLDAIEHKYVEEVGTMNIFFYIDDTLITPPLGGTILPGVTRGSVIELAKSKGINVEERRISIDEILEASKNGTLKEIFGSGTAAVVSPVGLIHHNGEEIELDREKMGPLAQDLYDTITSIHHGDTEDPGKWCFLI